MGELKKIHLMPSNIEFSCEAGQTILEAALSSNINLEYSCSNGRCGQCKALMLDGSVTDSIVSTVGLRASEILTCSSFPKTDLSIRAEYFSELTDVERKTVPAKVDNINYAGDDIVEITLRMPPTARFNFLAGQYIDLHWGAEKRSYSIASSKVQSNMIDLHIKKVEGGLFSDFLFGGVAENQLFRFFGPLGTFFLRAGDSPLIFLCTGSGFAPVKSMVESLIESDVLRSVHIFWGGQTMKDIYSDLPFKWAEEFGNIHFTPVLSREENMPSGAMSGYVQNAVVGLCSNLDESEVYACGSEQMILDARVLLVESGLCKESFHSDAFVSSN